MPTAQQIFGKAQNIAKVDSDTYGIPASIWTQLDSLSGVSIISVEDWKALQPPINE